MAKAAEETLSIYVTGAQLALLKKFAFPCSENVIASAVATDEGIELSGSRGDFESLAGWVAGEANHQRRGRAIRRTEMLDDIADQLEGALIRYRR